MNGGPKRRGCALSTGRKFRQAFGRIRIIDGSLGSTIKKRDRGTEYIGQMIMRKLALFVDWIRIESALAIAFIISVAWLGALAFALTG